MADRTLGRGLGNLALALFNATLILAALCLWLGWRALSTAEDVSDNVVEAAQTIIPLRDEIGTLTEELAALRTALVTEQDTAIGSREALRDRLSGIETQLTELNAHVAALAADPDAMIGTAVEAAFASLGASVGEALSQLRGGDPARTQPVP